MNKLSTRSLLKDNSWIKGNDCEDEDVDRDPNFGKTVLGHRHSETDTSTRTTITEDGKTTQTIETTTFTSLRSPVTKSSPMTETFSQRVLSSSKGQQYSSYSLPRTSEVSKKTVTNTTNAVDKLCEELIPSSTTSDNSTIDSRKTVTTTETVTVKSSGDTQAENQLYDRLIPKGIQDEASGNVTQTVTVRSSTIETEDDPFETYRSKSMSDVSSLGRGESPVSSSTTIRSYSSYTEDSPITTSYTISTKPSDDYNSDRRSFTYTRPSSSYEYSSITSPTSYTTTTYRSSSSRSNDSLSDPIYSKSSNSVYTSSERTVLEKDLCTTCRKPFTGDAKMVLEDMKINCHATCFKCDVCNSTLGNLKAGDSMWVYRGMVHCGNCFEVTKAKWRR